MKRCWTLALFCSSALFADTAHHIAGRVVDAQSGAPIARARVSVNVFRDTGAEEVLLLSDENGAFELRNVPEGNYQLSCARTGYLAHHGTSITIDAKSKDQPATLRMTPQAVIEGSVVDEKGAAVPFAQVQVLHRTVVGGKWTAQVMASDKADERGEFRFFGLAAGHFYLGVSLSSEARRAAKGAYPAVLYPNSRTIDGAQIIDLRAGQVEQLRIRLPAPLPAREIRGQVGSGGPDVNFELHPPGSPESELPMGFNLDWDRKSRNFRIWGIAAGEYELEATSFSGQTLQRASIRVTVRDRDISGIRLELREGAALPGKLRMEGPAVGTLHVFGIGLRSTLMLRAEVGEDGSFQFEHLWPDTYHVVLGENSGYLRSVTQGGRDVLRSGVVISADAVPEPIEVVVASPGGTIEGVIALPDAGQPASLHVVLLRRLGNEVVLEREMTVSRSGPLPGQVTIYTGGNPQMLFTGGQFTIEDVAPGDHLLYAWPIDGEVAYAEPEFLRQYESAGKTVTVTEGTTVKVTVDRLVIRAATVKER